MDNGEVYDNAVCQKCKEDYQILDFILSDINSYELGANIGGVINKYGWAVKKVDEIKKNVDISTLEVYCGVKNPKDVPLGLGNGSSLQLGGSTNCRILYDYTQGLQKIKKTIKC